MTATASIQSHRAIPPAREAELVEEARSIANGRTATFATPLHLLACVVRLDDALGDARLATEALEKADREKGELLAQLTAERARRIDLEAEIEAVDRAMGDVIHFASMASNRSAEAKRVVARPLYPEPAGSGAGAR